MKKEKLLEKNNKASVAIIAIILVIILAVAVIYIFTSSSNSFWETKTTFGAWHEEIIITYEDGTYNSLKLIQEGVNNPLAVKYDDKAITTIEYQIAAKATGTGYQGAELQFTGFGFNMFIMDGTNLKHTEEFRRIGMEEIYMDQKTSILRNGRNLDALMDEDPSTYPDGVYTVKFTPFGDVSYRGFPDGGDVWISAALPNSREVSVQVDRGGNGGAGQVVVTLYPEVVT